MIQNSWLLENFYKCYDNSAFIFILSTRTRVYTGGKPIPAYLNWVTSALQTRGRIATLAY